MSPYKMTEEPQLYWKYFKAVMRHKWYVFVECCKEGIPFRGLAHDWTKLLPSEFVPYAECFYGGKGETQEFKLAWKRHQHWFSHHWQSHILWNDSGYIEALPMPDEARREMLADWRGAGKAYADYEGAVYSSDSTRAWYLKNRDNMRLHPETRKWIEDRLGLPDEEKKDG